MKGKKGDTTWDPNIRLLEITARSTLGPGERLGESFGGAHGKAQAPDFETCWLAERGEGSIDEILEKFKQLRIEAGHVLEAVRRGEIKSEVVDMGVVRIDVGDKTLSVEGIMKDLLKSDQIMFVDIASAKAWYRKITAPSA